MVSAKCCFLLSFGCAVAVIDRGDTTSPGCTIRNSTGTFTVPLMASGDVKTIVSFWVPGGRPVGLRLTVMVSGAPPLAFDSESHGCSLVAVHVIVPFPVFLMRSVSVLGVVEFGGAVSRIAPGLTPRPGASIVSVTEMWAGLPIAPA